ncbi:putative cryptochrome-1, partial [Apostichopus japonicus]
TQLCGFNRWQFLHDCLKDIDDQFRAEGGMLYCFEGDPTEVLRKQFLEWNVDVLCFEQDPEPIWQERDNKVKELCKEMGVQCIEQVSHTLWNPLTVISENGGSPPLTYSLFIEVVQRIGSPPKPLKTPNPAKWKCIPKTEEADRSYKLKPLQYFACQEMAGQEKKRWTGGETRALDLYEMRLKYEHEGFKSDIVMINQFNPKLLDPPLSLSPYLRFGALSIRKFYWGIQEIYEEVKCTSAQNHVTAQLIWREYFYTMSVNNTYFDKMEKNPICLRINWYQDEEKLKAWTDGETGYPWIDACMKQLRMEGWIHQVARHAVACFLTRGDLWISWEEGLQVFYKYLLDADYSVCSGNWMWVSSSAFEKFLQCPSCFCPVNYGRRMDPQGHFVKKYIPALAKMPLKYLFNPWTAPPEFLLTADHPRRRGAEFAWLDPVPDVKCEASDNCKKAEMYYHK